MQKMENCLCRVIFERQRMCRDIVDLLLTDSLLYRQECFTGKYTTRKIHTKPHLGLGWRIFRILASEDIDYFTDIIFVP